MKTTHPTPYQSNPFLSSFKGFGELFERNQTLSIIILVGSFIVVVLQVLLQFAIPLVIAGAVSSSTDNSSAGSMSGFIIGLIVVGGLLATVVSIFISVVFVGMTTYIAYKTGRQETTTFKEAFLVTISKFWSILYATFIAVLKIIGGLFLFIVPGIRAALRYQMVVFPIFDENLSGSAAVKRIKFLTKDHLMEMFGLYTVVSLVSSLLPPIITLVQMAGQTVMYPQLKALKDSNTPKPPVHWLNYIGFIITGAVMLLIFLILILVIAISAN